MYSFDLLTSVGNRHARQNITYKTLNIYIIESQHKTVYFLNVMLNRIFRLHFIYREMIGLWKWAYNISIKCPGCEFVDYKTSGLLLRRLYDCDVEVKFKIQIFVQIDHY